MQADTRTYKNEDAIGILLPAIGHLVVFFLEALKYTERAVQNCPRRWILLSMAAIAEAVLKQAGCGDDLPYMFVSFSSARSSRRYDTNIFPHLRPGLCHHFETPKSCCVI
jgi:hypothetical protein